MATLLTWLGKTDLDNMKQNKHASISTIAIKGQKVNQIVILANNWEEDWFDYENWLKKQLAIANRPNQNISIQRARIASPIVLIKISQSSVPELQALLITHLSQDLYKSNYLHWLKTLISCTST